MSDWASLIPLALILVVFWLIIVMPTRRRQRQEAVLQSELAPGLEVMTTSGIFATIVELDESEARVRVAPGVEIRLHRQAIGQVVRPEPLGDGQ